MDKALYHTISITLSSEIQDQLHLVREKITNKFSDQYNYLAAGGTWGAHVGMFTLCITKDQGETMLNRAKRVIGEMKPFTLVLGDIGLSEDQRYVFLNFREDSETFLINLHNQLFNELDFIRNGAIPPKFLKHWCELTETEKELLVKTGNKYPFVPHFSLVKLNPEESGQAMGEINTHQFENVEFTVSRLDFTRQDEDKENEFPRIATISLGQDRQRLM